MTVSLLFDILKSPLGISSVISYMSRSKGICFGSKNPSLKRCKGRTVWRSFSMGSDLVYDFGAPHVHRSWTSSYLARSSRLESNQLSDPETMNS